MRKLKAKGAPEVVDGRDGIPLILPIDADMDDLRREACGEGKYRLDLLDEYNRPIPGCPAAYVCIYDGEPAVEPLAPSARKPAVTVGQRAYRNAARTNLRHAYGTHAALVGVNPCKLMTWMGHKRIDGTMLHVHFAEAHLRPLPKAVLNAQRAQKDPDKKVLSMLAARAKLAHVGSKLALAAERPRSELIAAILVT